MANQTITGLAQFIHWALAGKLEAGRLARAGYALFVSRCSSRASFPGSALASYLLTAQRADGGWVDVQETLWCLGYLAAFDDKYEVEFSKGTEWLDSVRLPCCAWGKSGRDQPRIPVTALASALVPEAVNVTALKWVADQWEAELANDSQLTYKGALFLLAQSHDQAPPKDELVTRTISYLCMEQNLDGGFGPWKDHPAGSDPWTTGVVLWGLSGFSHIVPTSIFTRSVSWLQKQQLPNGLWAYHYLDDGSAMALIGLSSILPFLQEK